MDANFSNLNIYHLYLQLEAALVGGKRVTKNSTAPSCEHVESTSCEPVESTTPMEKGCTAGLPNPGNDTLLASLNSRIEYLEEELRREKTKYDIYQKNRDYNSIFCVFVILLFQSTNDECCMNIVDVSFFLHFRSFSVLPLVSVIIFCLCRFSLLRLRPALRS